MCNKVRLVLVLQHLNNPQVICLQHVIELLLKNYLVVLAVQQNCRPLVRVQFKTCVLRHETQPTVHHTGGQNVERDGLLRRQNVCSLDHIQNFLNGVGGFDIRQGDDGACQGLHVDLHGITQLDSEGEQRDDAIN